MSILKFQLTETHIKLLKQLKWSISGEYLISHGEEEPESPFGGMNIYEDMDLIINGNSSEFDPMSDVVTEFSDEDKEEMLKIFNELPMAMDIIMFNGHFKCGNYKTKYHLRDWKPIKTK
jgi:hypothetical protein